MNLIDRLALASATSSHTSSRSLSHTSSHLPIPLCTTSRPSGRFHPAAALFLAVCSLILVACSTDKPSTPAPRPGAGLVEYRQLVKRSHDAVEASLQSLAKVSAQTRCSAGLVTSFSDEVDHMAAGSVAVRARSQAILARGDAYFENWTAHMDAMRDPKVRAQAEQHRPELQQRFAKIKSIGLDTRTAFQAYLGGLRQLRTALEADPGALTLASNQTLAATTRQSGLEVQHQLDLIRDELAAMAVLLVPR